MTNANFQNAKVTINDFLTFTFTIGQHRRKNVEYKKLPVKGIIIEQKENEKSNEETLSNIFLSFTISQISQVSVYVFFSSQFCAYKVGNTNGS